MILVTDITKRLEKGGIDSARTNAETILKDILNCRTVDLYSEPINLTEAQNKQLEDMLDKRLKGEPLQHITSKSNFYGNELLVKKGVFIPRPETEILVSTVLELVKYHELKILDLCTGSGNIAISLTKSLTHCTIISSDISEEALKLAKENACVHSVVDRIDFIRSDLFNNLSLYKNGFDIIVSNPPYISTSIINDLSDEVKRDPHNALDGGKDGLDFYARIIKEAPLFLKKDGLIALELGDDCCQGVKELLEISRDFSDVRVFNDLNNIERVITATSNG